MPFWRTAFTGDIGLTLVNLIYQQGFNENNLGMGCAIGITLLCIVMIVNIIQLSLTGFFKRRVIRLNKRNTKPLY